ncbi:MAG: hypothetical protein GWN62_28775 [Aliifodinibius sp.]|nr:hypothetical protein [Fodinibius sp.]
MILKLYDYGIVSISKKDLKKANLVLTELIAALNFDYNENEEAMGLFKLYRYCQDCLYKNDFEQPLEIFKELRDAWANAFNLS